MSVLIVHSCAWEPFTVLYRVCCVAADSVTSPTIGCDLQLSSNVTSWPLQKMSFLASNFPSKRSLFISVTAQLWPHIVNSWISFCFSSSNTTTDAVKCACWFPEASTLLFRSLVILFVNENLHRSTYHTNLPVSQRLDLLNIVTYLYSS